MSASEELDDVAGSVSDGTLVDWLEVGRSLSSGDPAILRELEVIARIAEVQRRTADEADAGPVSVQERQAWGTLRIEKELGSGAFGTVYRAFDPNLQNRVALKIYRQRTGTGTAASDVTTLLTEGRLLARVQHPNVVVVHGVEQRGDEVGLWMELVDGRTLAEEVRASGSLGFREAALIGQDLCRALAAVHLNGVVHRDVKPQNVMRERGGRIVLMDFGVGRDLQAISGPAETSGTPLYMAPELLQGAPASTSSDIYSLGVLLFHLVSGTHPVTATTRAGLEQAHKDGQRRFLRDVRPDLPDAFVQVIERACSPDPVKRFATAGAMEAALAGVLGLPSASENAAPRRRVPTLVWKTAVAAFVVVAIGTYVVISGRPPAAGAPIGETAARPGAASAVSQPGSYHIQAAFYRSGDDGDVRLAPGARVRPGDRLFAELQSSQSVHVYIVNQDERGESFLLYPLPGQSTKNPLTAGVSHKLPSPRSTWQVTSAGEREHFLIIASPEPMTPLEGVFAALPRAEPGRPVASAAPVPSDVIGKLRGIGGVASSTGGPKQPGGLFGSARALATEPESVAGVWMRQFTLENPRR